MKQWVYAIVGLLYGITLAFVWFASIGGGGAGHGPEHETNIILFFAAAPYGLGLLLWPVIGFMAGSVRFVRYKTTVLGLMATHYVGLIHHCWQYAANLLPFANGEKNGTEGYVTTIDGVTDQDYVLWATTLYLIGQACIWRVFQKAMAEKRNRVA